VTTKVVTLGPGSIVASGDGGSIVASGDGGLIPR
jgi:hypothetical protein